MDGDIPGWVSVLMGILASFLGALGTFIVMLRKSRTESRAADTRDRLDSMERENEIERAEDNFAIKQLRQIIKDLEGARRADELHCQGKIAALQHEVKELRESERMLFAECAKMGQLIQILKDRDRELRQGLQDHGIGVQSVEGRIMPEEPKDATK